MTDLPEAGRLLDLFPRSWTRSQFPVCADRALGVEGGGDASVDT